MAAITCSVEECATSSFVLPKVFHILGPSPHPKHFLLGWHLVTKITNPFYWFRFSLSIVSRVSSHIFKHCLLEWPNLDFRRTTLLVNIPRLSTFVSLISDKLPCHVKLLSCLQVCLSSFWGLSQSSCLRSDPFDPKHIVEHHVLDWWAEYPPQIPRRKQRSIKVPIVIIEPA